MTILQLWVSNQVGDSDATDGYIAATHFAFPAGVTFDGPACTISGAENDVWAAYDALARAVAEVGHGVDCDDEPAPILTACPVDLIEVGYTSAAESLARMNSIERW